ncbi:MAG TPA: HAD family phosphatase [Marinagarivorans sp.]
MKAVIFDCDGVLVDSEPVYAEAFSRTLAAYGCALPSALLAQALQGKSMADCYRWLATHWEFTVTSSFESDLFSCTDALIPEQLKAISDVNVIVEALECPIAVASNGVRRSVLNNLQLCRLRDYFGPHIYTAAEVGRAKPAPDVYLHAAAQLGVPAHDCLVIEDSALGVVAAQAAGMPVCWFGAAAKAEKLQQTSAASAQLYSAQTMAEVWQLLAALELLEAREPCC